MVQLTNIKNTKDRTCMQQGNLKENRNCKSGVQILEHNVERGPRQFGTRDAKGNSNLTSLWEWMTQQGVRVMVKEPKLL